MVNNVQLRDNVKRQPIFWKYAEGTNKTTHSHITGGRYSAYRYVLDLIVWFIDSNIYFRRSFTYDRKAQLLLNTFSVDDHN